MMSSQQPTHAGAVAYRGDGGDRRYLVVRALRAPHWVLPKGHVEAGEDLETAALRELREEAGVIGRVVAPLGVREVSTDRGGIVVAWFLVHWRGDTAADDQRERRWCSIREALSALTFEDARELVTSADRLLRHPSGS